MCQLTVVVETRDISLHLRQERRNSRTSRRGLPLVYGCGNHTDESMTAQQISQDDYIVSIIPRTLPGLEHLHLIALLLF